MSGKVYIGSIFAANFEEIREQGKDSFKLVLVCRSVFK